MTAFLKRYYRQAVLADFKLSDKVGMIVSLGYLESQGKFDTTTTARKFISDPSRISFGMNVAAVAGSLSFFLIMIFAWGWSLLNLMNHPGTFHLQLLVSFLIVAVGSMALRFLGFLRWLLSPTARSARKRYLHKQHKTS